MKSIAARLLILVLLAASLISVSNSASAAITSVSGCSGSLCLSESIDNSNPYVGDTVTFTGSVPDCDPEINCQVTDGQTFVAQNALASSSSLSVNQTNISGHVVQLTFGAAGTYSFSFWVYSYLGYFVTSNSEIFTVTVTNRPVPVGVPSNVTVAPHATSATVSWGVATRATSYTATASPSGLNCTTAQSTCSILGLTAGSQQTFTVTASNGTVSENSTSPATAPVTIAEPLQASGSISSATWKVGSAVTFAPVVIGVPTHTDIQWFRCDSATASSSSQSTCSTISGQSSLVYVLAAADIGKFVTAFIHVTAPSSDAMFTAATGRVTLAADASAPTPTQTPTSTASPSPTPTQAPSATTQVKLLSITTFKLNVTLLTTVEKLKIKAFLLANPKLNTLVCAGDVLGLAKSSAQLAIAKARASAVCAYAVTTNKAIKTRFSGSQSKYSGAVSRLVKLTLSN